jgi:hypothetical protein
LRGAQAADGLIEVLGDFFVGLAGHGKRSARSVEILYLGAIRAYESRCDTGTRLPATDSTSSVTDGG